MKFSPNLCIRFFWNSTWCLVKEQKWLFGFLRNGAISGPKMQKYQNFTKSIYQKFPNYFVVTGIQAFRHSSFWRVLLIISEETLLKSAKLACFIFLILSLCIFLMFLVLESRTSRVSCYFVFILIVGKSGLICSLFHLPVMKSPIGSTVFHHGDLFLFLVLWYPCWL